MTEQQLISRLQELKQIRPRKEWVVLSKMNILRDSIIESNIGRGGIVKPVYHWNFPGVLILMRQKKLAYSFAVLLFIFAGVAGLLKYGLLQNIQNVRVAGQSQVSVVAETALKDNVEDFKIKSKNLSQMSLSNPEDISVALKEVKNVAREITDAIKKDPELAKAVALDINNNKTYLNIVSGDDLQGSLDELNELDELYKTTVKSVIEDLDKNKTNLTESQREALKIAKGLYEEERYTDALESILLLSMAIENN